MSDQMSFLLFGDQSSDTYTFLSDFCRRGSPSLLSQSFLQQASVALKAEVDGLSVLHRKRIPNFSSIEQLNRRYNESNTKYPAVDSALVCVAQLAHYIEYVYRSPIVYDLSLTFFTVVQRRYMKISPSHVIPMSSACVLVFLPPQPWLRRHLCLH